MKRYKVLHRTIRVPNTGISISRVESNAYNSPFINESDKKNTCIWDEYGGGFIMVSLWLDSGQGNTTICFNVSSLKSDDESIYLLTPCVHQT